MTVSERRKRTLARTLTWRASGVPVAMVLTFLMTGDLQLGIGLGISYNLVRFATHYLHERMWSRVKWGIEDLSQETPPTSSERGAVPLGGVGP